MIFRDKDVEAGARELYKQTSLLQEAGIPWDLALSMHRKPYVDLMVSALKAMKAPMNLKRKK